MALNAQRSKSGKDGPMDLPPLRSRAFSGSCFLACCRMHERAIILISCLVVFLSPSDKPFQDRSPTPSLLRPVDALRHLAQAEQWSEGFVVVGRRQSLSDEERKQLKEYNASLKGATVHTYDWLVDVAMNLKDWAATFAMNRFSWKSTHYDGFKPPS
jgi:hypothetical protein